MIPKFRIPLILLAAASPLAFLNGFTPLQEYDRDPSDLIGIWQVDLRPTPDAEEYFQEMVITSVEGDSISGTFYGSPIRNGSLNLDWGAVRFAFVTADGSGEYYTSGTLESDRITGLTHSKARGFLAYWSAQQVVATD